MNSRAISTQYKLTTPGYSTGALYSVLLNLAVICATVVDPPSLAESQMKRVTEMPTPCKRLIYFQLLKSIFICCTSQLIFERCRISNIKCLDSLLDTLYYSARQEYLLGCGNTMLFGCSEIGRKLCNDT